MNLESGTSFDRYRIEQCIGEGGMGRVYRAHDERLQRLVALKILRSTGSAEVDARFIREARAAAALNHANAVSIFDVGEIVRDGELVRFIAMELVEGRDVRSLANESTITREHRLRWLADVARVLDVAHRAGIVHRDIKPENVMVRADGVLKVLDFGLARRASVPTGTTEDPSQPLRTLTERGVVVGTPVYMSPEQLRGDAVDGRSDQFSWGVMAYELLSGAVPWKRRTEAIHLIAEILGTDPPPLAALVPDLPATVSSAIDRALSKSADARFPTMQDLVERLDALPGGSVGPLPFVMPLSRAPLAFAPTVQSTRTSMAAAEAKARSRFPRARSRARVLAVAGASVVAVAAIVAWRAKHDAVGPSSTPAPTTAPTAVTELALVPGTRADVASEYRQAMERLRFADLHGAGVHATRAIELDPSFAPALLYLAMRFLRVSTSDARDAFRRAEEHVDRLTDRDRALLQAYKPLIQGVPPDPRETRARLEALVDRLPADAGLRAELADVDSYMGDLAAAVAQLGKARELDPGFGYAIAAFAEYSAGLGDLDGAIRATEDCVKLAPSVPSCTNIRADLERQLGQCAQLEARMRRAIAVEPAMPDWYAPLAEALFEEGRSLGAVREASDQGVDHTTPAARSGIFASYYPIVVDVLAGDFPKADDELRAAEASPELAQSPDASMHALPAWLRVEIAWETGRNDVAANVAQKYLDRSEAWSGDPAHDAYVMSKEVEPLFLRALRIGKRIDAAEEARRRDAWIDRWMTAAPMLKGQIWLKAYAEDLTDPSDARAAMEQLARFEPLPKFAPDWAVEARVGRARMLAGDAAGALPSLRGAAASCSALAQPFEKMHALLSLGDALAQSGDRAHACEAYARVLATWGKATPRSVTADAARAHAGTNGCTRR